MSQPSNAQKPNNNWLAYLLASLGTGLVGCLIGGLVMLVVCVLVALYLFESLLQSIVDIFVP